MSKFIDVDDNRFFVRSLGNENKPILLKLHRFLEYSGAWEEVSEYLSDKFYCLAPDQRGYGKSYVPERVEDYKMELLIQDLKGSIEHFRRPVLVEEYDWGLLRLTDLQLPILNWSQVL